MKIAVFESKGFTPLPEFTAEDVRRHLASRGQSCLAVDAIALESFKRAQADLLILPYVRGNFSREAMAALLGFHAGGGSLLFLGDLPNRDAWFPGRNMESWRLHLTRCGEGVNITGLTPFGQDLLGELPGLAEMSGKDLPGLRITAFPPDETHCLFSIRSHDHSTTSRAVVCVERKGEPFMGAKLAVIGFIGGEPRENVQGVYQLPWTHNPGLLTRDWAGIGPLLDGLIRWLEPAAVAGAIELDPVHPLSAGGDIRVRLTTPAGAPVSLDQVRLVHGDTRQSLDLPELTGRLQGARTAMVRLPRRPFGITPYTLVAKVGGTEQVLAETREYVMPDDTASFPGFGASTFWAFQDNQVPEEYFTFLRELRRGGCQYIRANIPWEDIEPEPGRYDWTIPDTLADFAAREGLLFSFWLFPVTRGAGLGDGGVPAWSLKEPAIDKDGKPGNFPTLWSPFYRKHYFAMIDALTRRYAHHAGVWRYVLDFGNSDFPYGYYYYGNPSTWFDYSPIEREAFSRYLCDQRGYSLEQIGALYKRPFTSLEEVPVPRADQDPEAWGIYLDFREWTIQGGIREVFRICAANAPGKVPPDLPGHGAGSIADISSLFLEVKARHWLEERKFEPRHVNLHNSGREWGGEAWQVGGNYRQYDDALFQSLRANANYYTLPGPDIGLDGDTVVRNGFIRRTIMGARRPDPELAVIDRLPWNAWDSLAHVATRLDQGADLLCRQTRFDFSCYRLLALPPDELVGQTATLGTAGTLLPVDEGWYWLIRESVEKGLNLLVFPDSCQPHRTALPLTFLRRVLELDDVRYGDRRPCTVKWPASFESGTSSGMARSVLADGEVLVRDASGQALLVRRPCGRGSVLLAGYDCRPDSPDGDHQYERDATIGHHSLNRLCMHLGIVPRHVRTNQAYVTKERVSRAGRDYLLMFSHLPNSLTVPVQIRLNKPSTCAYDLATGERFPVRPAQDGWVALEVPLHTRTGRYLSFHDRNT